MVTQSTSNGINPKSVAFQHDLKIESKAGSMPKLCGEDGHRSSKVNSDHSLMSPIFGNGKINFKKKGQLNLLVHPLNQQSHHKLGMHVPLEFKSSQGFFLNENLIQHQHHHHHQQHPQGYGNVRVSSSNGLQQYGSSPNLNSYTKLHYQNDLKLGNESIGAKFSGANISQLGSHDQLGNQPAFGYSTMSTTNKKWSQEQVYTTFYKKRENNDVILIPDKFWEQDKTFVPFKKIWADHEQQNSQMVTQYLQKRENKSQQDDSARKFMSQTNLEDHEVQQTRQLHNSMISKKQNRLRVISSETVPVKLPLTNKQKQQSNLSFYKGEDLPLENENSILQHHKQFKKNLQESNTKSTNNKYLKKGFLSDDAQQMSNRMDKSSGLLGSLSALEEQNNNNNNSKKGGQQNGFLPNMNNGNQIKINQNNSMMDLTQKDEIELQLNQNRYSQNVYDTKIMEIEQQVYNETFEKIQLTQQQIDKMQRKTRVYNKHNIIESLDTQPKTAPDNTNNNNNNKKNNILVNEREFAIQRPSIICCWVDNDQDMWKPQPRIGSSISIGGYDGKKEMILIGGISSEMVKDVLVIDSESYQYDTLKHLQEQRRQEQEQYREEMLRRKSIKDRNKNKRNSILFNVQNNNASASTPSSKKQQKDQQPSEKQQQQDYEDLFNKYLYGKDNYSQRYNHTTVEIQRKTKLLIFGGEILNNDQSHQAGQARQKLRPHHRNCLNDLISFDIQNYEWRAHIGRGEIIEARRNHTANMVGQKHMVIIGGLNSEGRALDDMYILDINTFRWINVHVVHNKYVHPFTQGIVYHATCFVSEDENSSSINILGNGYYNLLNQNTNHKDKKNPSQNQNQYIKEEGLYLFGGVDSTNNYIKNKMFVLKQNGNPPNWIELNTLGRAPERRCMHSLSFMFNMSICILYGGKFESQNSTRYYDDLHVLNLKNHEWIQVNLEGNRKPPRAMHTTCINHKQLIVFGGLNDKGFLKGNIEIIEFDQMIVLKMKRQQNYSLTLHLELTTKQQSKMEDPLLLQLMSKGESKDNQPPQNIPNTMNMQKMKDRVFLIDPEQEREIKQHLEDLKNAPKPEIAEEKWKPPQKSQSSNEFQQKKFWMNNSSGGATKTYLPIPFSILKKKDM